MVAGAGELHTGSLSQGRLISIQLLRFVSAIWVVVLHQAFAFAEYMGSGLGLSAIRVPGNLIGNIAVCGFFIISGYIMVVSSRHLFGQPDARRIFWTRRAVRILPPYWIATLLLVAIVVVLRGGSFGFEKIAKSLALWPYWSGEAFTLPLPIMWVGWTLFYEMVFYFLFGLFVAYRRAMAIGLTVAALFLLALAGQAFEPQGAPLWMVSRPVVLVFICGMALALWRERGGSLSASARLATLALAIAVPFLTSPFGHFDPHSPGYLVSAALPATLFSLALFGGDIAWPRPALIDRLGDISFALYLLHVPAAHFWTFVWQSLPLPGGAWGFMITLAIGTLVASWLFFLWVERPMTRWLNAKLGAAKAPSSLQPAS